MSESLISLSTSTFLQKFWPLTTRLLAKNTYRKNSQFQLKVPNVDYATGLNFSSKYFWGLLLSCTFFIPYINYTEIDAWKCVVYIRLDIVTLLKITLILGVFTTMIWYSIVKLKIFMI